jgi:Ser/Thr protein kinase RdoA (MazF antagonist)
MEQLRVIVREENDFLKSGMPSSLFEWREAKQTLADRYAQITARITQGIATNGAGDPAILNMLVEATHALKELTDENMALLEGAITASRRRIEAVLAAAKVDETTAFRYSGDAKLMQTARIGVPSPYKS